jgi:hypothetical protein
MVPRLLPAGLSGFAVEIIELRGKVIKKSFYPPAANYLFMAQNHTFFGFSEQRGTEASRHRRDGPPISLLPNRLPL